MTLAYTPLRYPGGKSKLAPYVKAILTANQLADGVYAEPYAGGAGVALELLLHEYVSTIHINDVSPPIGAFWRSVLDHSEELCELIRSRPISVREWDRQKRVQLVGATAGDVALGFSTFYLNRTNRSGILNGGIIGGRKQDGDWKIDARYNKCQLIDRIRTIASQRRRINFTQLDAITFMQEVATQLPTKSLVYLDPPYYVKGKALYHHHYQPEDHASVATMTPLLLGNQKWIVSYDNVPEIRALYRGFSRIAYRLGYSAHEVYDGTEIMFFSPGLKVPTPIGAMKKAA